MTIDDQRWIVIVHKSLGCIELTQCRGSDWVPIYKMFLTFEQWLALDALVKELLPPPVDPAPQPLTALDLARLHVRFGDPTEKGKPRE